MMAIAKFIPSRKTTYTENGVSSVGFVAKSHKTKPLVVTVTTLNMVWIMGIRPHEGTG